jgi:GMP synthase-like glutamine amidotransferase
VKIHVLQHVPFEDVGSMEAWFGAHGAKAGYTRFFENPALPDPEKLDLVVAMGGPMSVNDESGFPWLRAEKRFLRAAIDFGVPVLGVCLGAQLIASAMGCRVYRHPAKEIGWFPIEATGGMEDGFRFPSRFTAFHWHGETFDLPEGSVRLARSEACENQAFQLRRRVIGLQFHLETTPRTLEALIDNCSGELVPGKYIQSASRMRSVSAEVYEEVNRMMNRVLDCLTPGGRP